MDTLQVAVWVLGGLVGVIGILIGVLWQMTRAEQKAQDEAIARKADNTKVEENEVIVEKISSGPVRIPIDLDGDGMIDRVTAHPNRAPYVKDILPYYARAAFDWNNRQNWINDQNAVNYWIKNIKPSQYPTDFSGKSY